MELSCGNHCFFKSTNLISQCSGVLEIELLGCSEHLLVKTLDFLCDLLGITDLLWKGIKSRSEIVLLVE